MESRVSGRVETIAVRSWYLYRCDRCHAAEPNAGHHALARMERALASASP